MIRRTSRGPAGTGRSERARKQARRGAAGALAIGVVGLALPLGSAVTTSASGLSQAEPVSSMASTPVSRPLSPDAAERWWLSCTADLPGNPDAAERWIRECW